jgi:hypothetical protein
VNPADERVTGIAQDATVGFAEPKQAERQRRWMEALPAQPIHDFRHRRRVIDGFVRICATGRLGGIDTVLPTHLVKALGAIVVRRERVVVDRPGWRDAVAVLHRLEVLAPQPIQHAAPELGVSSNVVVGVGTEFAAALVEPLLLRLIAEILPDGGRIPVLVLLGHEITTLEDQDPSAAPRQRIRHRAAAGAAPDDDHVEVFGHASCPASA